MILSKDNFKNSRSVDIITILYLLLAIFFEVAGTTSMKLSYGFTNLWPSVLIFVFYSGAFFFLTLTLKRLELSLAYAIWSGLGTMLIALIGIFYFNESVTFIKILSLTLIVMGVVGLRLG